MIVAARPDVYATDANALIARRFRESDPDLIHELIELHQHRLMRYLMFLTQRRDQAEDLFQEVWLRVLRSGAGYNGSSSFDTWLCTIGRNLFLDQKRRRTMVSFEELREGEDADCSFDPPHLEPSVLKKIEVQEESVALNSAILDLHSTQRAVLLLRYRDELSLTEISHAIQLPLSTVKSQLYRGIAMIKKKVQRRSDSVREIDCER